MPNNKPHLKWEHHPDPKFTAADLRADADFKRNTTS
jgi:hypothetical protein